MTNTPHWWGKDQKLCVVVGCNYEIGCVKARHHCTADFQEKSDGLLTFLAYLPHSPLHHFVLVVQWNVATMEKTEAAP